MSDIDRPAHDPLEQNMDENAQRDEVTEAIVGEEEVASAEESAMNTDNESAREASSDITDAEKIIGVEVEAAEAELAETPKKKKGTESTSEKAKKAAAAREAAGLDAKPVSKKQLDPLRLRGKQYRKAVKLVDRNMSYAPVDAFELVKESAYGKLKEKGSVEIHIKVKNDNVRGTITLPHGTGKTKKVVIANDELLEALAAGKFDFDILIATPAQMPKLAKFAKVLGPKGLMPSPKAGTVTDNPEKVMAEISGGRVEYRADKNGVVHMAIGKLSFSTDKLVENYKTLEAVLLAAKIQSVSTAATMGPGVKIQVGA